jgi:hypothetical protein
VDAYSLLYLDPQNPVDLPVRLYSRYHFHL